MLRPDAVHDVLSDRAHLAVRRSRNDHECIRQGELACHVDEHRVDAATVVGGTGNQARQL